MRDTDFTVTGVTEADVIHASKADLPKIFRVTTSQIHGTLPNIGNNTTGSTSSNGSTGSEGPVARQYTLLMADNNEVMVILLSSKYLKKFFYVLEFDNNLCLICS